MSKIFIDNKVLDISYVNSLRQDFYVGAYDVIVDSKRTSHVLLYTKPIKQLAEPLPLRINSACLTSDIFEGSIRCDCKWQLDFSRNYIYEIGNGMIIYSYSDVGRGQGIITKLKAYELMDKKGISTKEAFEKLGVHPDPRSYGVQAEILKDLGFCEVELITNNLNKVQDLEKNGIKVVKRIPVVNTDEPILRAYLLSKERDFGHLISEVLYKDEKP